MSVNIAPVDLSSVVVGTSDRINFISKQYSLPPGDGTKPAHAVLLNESGCGLDISLNGGRQDRIPAGGWRVWELTSTDTGLVWSVIYVLQNQPVSKLLVTIYSPGEVVPDLPILGNSPTGISGLVTTSTASAIQNDGNILGTSIIEATPAGQGSSSWAMNNDASGFIQILSLGILRKIVNAVRGTGAAHAVVTIGDSGDVNMTTIFGNLGAASMVPPGNFQAGAYGFHADASITSQAVVVFANDGAGLDDWQVVLRPDNGLSFFDTNTSGNIILSSAGGLTLTGILIFNLALSAGNQLMNLEQGYGIYSDNTGAIGTTRNWWDGPDRGELQLGPRTGANFFDWIRLRATRVTLNLGKNASPNSTLFDVSGGPTQLDGNKLSTDGTNGTLTKVGGVSTAGSFGVPVIVAQAIHVHITATGVQTVLSYTPTVTGLYRINFSCLVQNTAVAHNITASFSYTDPDTGGAPQAFFVTTSAGASNNAMNPISVVPPTTFATQPVVCYAASGFAILVTMNDATGVPNDFASAVIERLA